MRGSMSVFTPPVYLAASIGAIPNRKKLHIAGITVAQLLLLCARSDLCLHLAVGHQQVDKLAPVRGLQLVLHGDRRPASNRILTLLRRTQDCCAEGKGTSKASGTAISSMTARAHFCPHFARRLVP